MFVHRYVPHSDVLPLLWCTPFWCKFVLWSMRCKYLILSNLMYVPDTDAGTLLWCMNVAAFVHRSDRSDASTGIWSFWFLAATPKSPRDRLPWSGRRLCRCTGRHCTRSNWNFCWGKFNHRMHLSIPPPPKWFIAIICHSYTISL
jgi:hypothetical protein